MSNTITIELCAEDRARLDRQTTAIEALTELLTPKNAAFNIDHEFFKNLWQREAQSAEQLRIPDELLQPKPAEEAKNEPQESVEQEAPATTHTEEEKPAEVKETAPEEVKPTITLAQIQQKVVQLCAANNGAKKDKVREIVNAYAKKVSDLPADKWDEIWSKLAELEEA